MIVWTKNDKAIVRCDYSEKELVKAIGDYKFDKESKVWVFPINKLVNIIDSLKIAYDPETEKVYQRLRAEIAEYRKKVTTAALIKTDRTPTGLIDDPALQALNLGVCMAHQIKAIQLGALFGSYAFFMQTGTGKTLVAIRLMEYFKVPSMVVAPLYSLENTWKKEINKWSGLKSVVLWDNLKEFKPGYDVYLINYEQFKKLHTQTKGKIHDLIKAIYVDESAKLKSHDSQITKTINEYRNKVQHKFCLTGTPNPNNLLEYHGQMRFVNDTLLPDNYYKFRNTYFVPVGYGGFQHVPAKGAKEAIIDCVSRQAYSIRKEDCFDLPERVFEDYVIHMDEAQERAYDEMLKENVIELREHTILAANELVKLMKLRQVTAGFLLTPEGAEVFISRKKIDALVELVDSIPEDKQIIIWCQFHAEVNELKKIYPDAALIYGGVTPKEKDAHLNRWLDNKTRIMIGHPKSGGTSLNLQQCSYMIWFSLSYSQEEFSQACDRIYRHGQKNKCTYYMMLAKRKEVKSKKDITIDEIIYDALIKKQDLMSSCMDLLKK